MLAARAREDTAAAGEAGAAARTSCEYRSRQIGRLERAVCVGVVSAEGPAELSEESDLTVEGPEGWIELLAELAA